MLVDVTSVEVGISVDVMGLIQLENKAMKFWVRGGVVVKVSRQYQVSTLCEVRHVWLCA